MRLQARQIGHSSGATRIAVILNRVLRGFANQDGVSRVRETAEWAEAVW